MATEKRPLRGPLADSPAGQRAAHPAALPQFEALSTIFDALDLIVYVADFKTHEVLFVNARTAKTFGDGWHGKRCWEYLQAGQTGPCAFCTNHLLVRDGVPQPPHSWEFRNTINRRWYLCIDQAIPWTDGRLVRMEAAVDITEQKENERFREQYVGLVAHDLANPLNTLLLVGQVLERKLEKQGLTSELEALGQVMGNARRMEAMIRDLHESVRLEKGALALTLGPVDVVKLAEDLVRLLPPADQRVTVRGPAFSAELTGDGPRLQRVIQNLVNNALQISPAGSPVTIEISAGADEVSVTVSDEGPGVPAEHQAHVFDRSYRVPGSRHDGLGLGLYICRLVVEGHGGQVTLESRPGHGAKFRFTIPKNLSAPVLAANPAQA